MKAKQVQCKPDSWVAAVLALAGDAKGIFPCYLDEK